MSVILMICFARSGGTILNKCLGSLPNVVMLSEVNPVGGGWGKEGLNSFTTVKAQAKNWYQIDLNSDDFVESILELEQKCEDSGKHLVIRDWSFVNFEMHEYNNCNPANRFLTLEELEGKCNVIPFAFIRDSIDVWISRGTPKTEEFFDSYLSYVKEILDKDIQIFRYEDFCRNSELTIKNICSYTGLKYSDSYQNYASFENVNGDVQIKGGSRGMKQDEIKLLPRKPLPKDKIIEVNRCEKMIEANRLLEYQDSYHGNLSTKMWLNKAIKYLQK